MIVNAVCRIKCLLCVGMLLGNEVRPQEVAAVARVTVGVDRNEVAFGEPVNILVRITPAFGQSVDVYTLRNLVETKVSFLKDKKKAPFVWSGFHQAEDGHKVTLKDGVLQYALTDVFVPPGAYAVVCQLGEDKSAYASDPVRVVVHPPAEGKTFHGEFWRLGEHILNQATDNDMDVVLPRLRGMLFHFGDNPSDFMVKLLETTVKMRGRAASLMKGEAIQALGQWMNKDLAAERKRTRGDVKGADAIRLMRQERSRHALYHYFMITPFMDDLWKEADQAALEALIEKHKTDPDKNVAYGACMAGIGNAIYRSKYKNILQQEIRDNSALSDGAKGILRQYLENKTL